MVSARIRTSQVLASLLSALLYVPTAAQNARVPQPQDDAKVRLASREEGEAIVEVAWELRRGFQTKPDCSHFVNAIYERAGLEYEYASTSEIFEGIDSFRRVWKPQPGDLVVWQGHIGIVVDPDEHTFYSSVIAGFAIENYQSRYWISRGRRRFYRYLIDEAHRARLLAHRDNRAAKAPAGPRPKAQSRDESKNETIADPQPSAGFVHKVTDIESPTTAESQRPKAKSQRPTAAPMILEINGETRSFPDGLTVAALVGQLGMKTDRVAVELNRAIVPHSNWDTTRLQDGDKLEIVHFVGGGADPY